MKKNKFVSLILVLLLMASMVLSAYADGSSTGGTGTITIQKGVSGKNYKLYQLFVLNSYNTENNNNQYSYTVNSNWTSFFAMDGAGYDPCDLFRFPVLTQKERRSDDQRSYFDFVQNQSASSMPGRSCPPSPGLLPGCAGLDAGGGATVVPAVGAVVAAGGAVVVTAGLSA